MCLYGRRSACVASKPAENTTPRSLLCPQDTRASSGACPRCREAGLSRCPPDRAASGPYGRNSEPALLNCSLLLNACQSAVARLHPSGRPENRTREPSSRAENIGASTARVSQTLPPPSDLALAGCSLLLGFLLPARQAGLILL